MKYISAIFAATSLIAMPAIAQTAPAPTDAAPSTAAPSVTVGAQVMDTSNAPVGTVEAVANGNATINTGSVKAAVPVASFAQGQGGLVLGMTKAQLEAAVASSKPAEIAVGTPVKGPKGNPVGTVTAVSGAMVTLQTATTKVQLAKTAFAKGADGGLVIGMTAEQLDAAAKAATPGKAS